MPTIMTFKIFLYRLRNDRTIDLRRANESKHKQTGNVMRHYVYIRVVPFNGEEENEQTKRERNKQRNP